MKKPLLSHILLVRNDNYLGNFKQRLEMCINYICKNVVQSGNKENYELIICDWNSDSPIRHELYLTQDAMDLAKFIEVPAPLVKEIGLDKTTLAIPHAINIGIRHASAEMIMLSPADFLLPLASTRNLFSLLKGEMNCPIDIYNCYLGIERFLIPWQLSSRMTLDSIDKDLFLYSNALHRLGNRYAGFAAGEGAHVMSREILTKIGGIDESMLYWGGHEVQLGLRINQFAPIVKGSLFGIFSYDLQQQESLRSKEIKMNENFSIDTIFVNDEDWGLANIEGIEVKKAEKSLPSPHTSSIKPFASQYEEGYEEKNTILHKFMLSLFSKDYIKKEKCLSLSLFNNDFINLGLKTLRIKAYSFIIMGKEWLNTIVKHDTIAKLPLTTSFISDYFDSKELYKQLEAFTFSFVQPRYPVDKIYTYHIYYIAFTAFLSLKPVRILNLNAFYHAPVRVGIDLDNTLQITSYHENGSVLWDINGNIFDGYLHLVAGPKEDLFTRLKNTELVNEAYDMLILDLKYWDKITKEVAQDMFSMLSQNSRTSIILNDGENRNEAYQQKILTYFEELGYSRYAALPHIHLLIRD